MPEDTATGADGSTTVTPRAQERGEQLRSRPAWGSDAPGTPWGETSAPGGAHAPSGLGQAPGYPPAGQVPPHAGASAGGWAQQAPGYHPVQPAGPAGHGPARWLGWLTVGLAALTLLGLLLPWLTMSVDTTGVSSLGGRSAGASTTVNAFSDMGWTDDLITVWEKQSQASAEDRDNAPSRYGIEPWGATPFHVEMVIIGILSGITLAVAGSAATQRALWKSAVMAAASVASLVLGIIGMVQLLGLRSMIDDAVKQASNGQYGSTGRYFSDGQKVEWDVSVGPGLWMFVIGLVLTTVLTVLALVRDLRGRRAPRAPQPQGW